MDSVAGGGGSVCGTGKTEAGHLLHHFEKLPVFLCASKCGILEWLKRKYRFFDKEQLELSIETSSFIFHHYTSLCSFLSEI